MTKQGSNDDMITPFETRASNHSEKARRQVERCGTKSAVESTTVQGEIRERQRSDSQFFSIFFHEIRTPITNLALRLHLLERASDNDRDKHIRSLKKQIEALIRLVNDVSELRIWERNCANTQYALVNLHTIIEEIVEANRPAAESSGIALIVKTGTSAPIVQGNCTQLTQVLSNLLVNALKYTVLGEVTVCTNVDTDNAIVHLSVQDTGIGIHPEDLPQIFELFYRGRNAQQSDIPGSGVGLGLVKRIVELHHGTIEIQSRLGEGATVFVSLPIMQPE